MAMHKDTMNMNTPAGANTAYAPTYGAPDQGRKSKLWLWLVVILLLAAAAGAAWYLTQGSGAAAATDEDGVEESKVPVVSVIRPGTQTITREITATGTLAARRDIPVGVVGEGGQVVSVLTDEGRWVKKGQTLVVVDRQVQNAQLGVLNAQVKSAESDLRLAENELARAAALVDRGFISKADVDRKRAARDAAAARLQASRASVVESQTRTARLDIRAPVSGYVLQRNVEVGQVISAGSPALFRIAEGGEMELQAQLSEDDLARVSVGVAATVTPVGTETQLNGQIWQIAPIIDAQSRQGIARIALPYSEQLRPGGFANTVIRAGAITAPMLPESAIMNDDKGSYVYIVGNGNKVERRDVVQGLVTDNGVAIQSGLRGDELIVLRAGGFLNPGEVVKPKTLKEKA